MSSMGFPMPALFAWLASLSEFAGGLFLAVGLFTRPAAFFVAFTMAIAFFVAHSSDPFKTKELAFLYMAAATSLIFIGSGRFSLDAVIRKRL
ncbi:MAG TPA: DoxX family protein [Bdellovibrionota bacterium]|nr:DoxX family protein [Bdellovibrionota bacterium]